MTQIVKKQEKKEIDKATIKKQKTRIEKAFDMWNKGMITRKVDRVQTYMVDSETKKDIRYMVQAIDFKEYTCNCVDFEKHRDENPNHECKHILLVKIAEENSHIKQEIYGAKRFEDDDYDF